MNSGATSSRFAAATASPSSQSPIRLQLLGLPRVYIESSEHPLAATRPMQLLVYLAVRGSWQPREDVAQVLWPDRSSKIAHSNLRNLLVKSFVAAPFARIESTEHALRLIVPSDLGDFAAAAQRGDAEATVQIGADELLMGFDSHATEPWQRWLQRERDKLQTQWVSSVQTLLAQPSRPIEQRSDLADRWARRCPYDEDAVHARMLIARERGQSGAAASLYRAFAALLRAEFGVNPSRELERFAHEIGPTPHLPPPHGANTAPSNSSPSEQRSIDNANDRSSAMVGRRLELRQLKALLADNTVRLITLNGTGGVGKSTLMAELYAQRAGDSEAHTVLVDASAARNAQAVIGAIASALGIDGAQGANNEVALADTLRDRPYLLMIDGAEQTDLAAPFALLLARCPHTRLLVASRGLLQLDCEHVHVLDGFPLPDADETDVDVLASNDGVHYFATVMAHAGQPSDLTHNASHIAALVHVVDGLPLALRLLARLTRVFSMSQLLDSVRSAMSGASEQSSRGLGELMPGLIASFDHSWTALSAVEQAVLARLAVFPAGFDVAAACAVAATELPVITSLMDRSLVRFEGAGRMSLHAGIRACVLAVCPVTDDTITTYVEHYTQRLVAFAGIAKSRTIRPLHQFLDVERVHLDYVLALALERRDYPTLLHLQESVWFVADASAGALVFNAWRACTKGSLLADASVPLALRAILLAGMAHDALNERRLAEAFDYARLALRKSRSARHRDSGISAMRALIYAHAFQRNTETSGVLVPKLVSLLAGWEEGVLAMQAPELHGLLAYTRGDLADGLMHFECAAQIAREVGDHKAEMIYMINMSTTCHRLGLTDRAIEYEEQALVVGAPTKAGSLMLAGCLADFARAHTRSGNLAQANVSIVRAMTIADDYPHHPMLSLKIRLGRAAIFIAQNDLLSARDHLVVVLDAIIHHADPAVSTITLLVTAKWFRRMGDIQACLGVLREIRRECASVMDFEEARAMLEALGVESVATTSPENPQAQISKAAVVARLQMMGTAVQAH